MGRIYQRKRGGAWWADWTHPTTGERHQHSLKTRDRKVATQRLQQAELAATPSAKGRKQRLSEAIEYVITTLTDRADATREFYQEKGRRIITTLGDPYVHDVTRDMMSIYIAKRLSSDPEHGGAGTHTVQKELIVLRRALREAHDRGVLQVMPAIPKHSPKYKPKETWLTETEFNALLSELEPERQLWVALATLAGGSAGEVERVNWATVNLVDGVLRMPGTKRESRDRWVPIAPAMYTMLDKVKPAQRVGLLAGHWGNVRRDLHTACDRAGIKRVSPNDLRRTFASWMVQNGVDLFTVSKLMGHTSTRMVEKVYGKLTRENMRAAVDAVPAFKRVTPVSLSAARSALLPPTISHNLDQDDES